MRLNGKLILQKGEFEMTQRSIAIAVLLVPVMLAGGCFWAEPEGIGLDNGTLKPCPESPNCVSSREKGQQRVEPLEFNGTLDETQKEIVAFLKEDYGASVVDRSDTYLYLTVRTTLGFVDDLQFRFVPTKSIVHVRSASRVGRSDLGVNRERVEALRNHLRGSDE
jgi:uncharacterized protein (DUF1499 family)